MFGLFLSITSLHAQYPDAPNALSIKRTFINFEYPYTGLPFVVEDYTPGIELEYIRSLGNYLNVAVPVKIGEGRIPVDQNKAMGPGIFGSVDALLQLKYFEKDALFYPYAFGGVGVQFANGENNMMFPVGAGLNIRLLPHLYISAQTEYRFSNTEFRANLQHGIGATFILGAYEGEPEMPADRDLDGVSDIDDMCPDDPGPAELFGCPDRDGDGVADNNDSCPDVAGSPSLYGCPDSDGDGIADSDDECPTLAGVATLNGCPDSDGDGVADGKDDCPTVAGLASLAGCPDRDGDGIADGKDDCPDAAGSIAANGCPDSDGDGVLDKEDRCPNTAGTKANFGCPEIKVEDAKTLEFAAQAVEFETGSAKITSNSFAILDQIVDILQRYSDYNMDISGHTDSIGSASANQALSEKRAKACYDYFVSKGIAASRMTSAGYGEDKPIADNKYNEGRQKNRRVEFDLHLK